MKVLVVGSGGREHALVRSLVADPQVTDVVAAPGNPGIAAHARCEPVVDITDADAIARIAARHTVDLVVVGPEAPLVAGVADTLRAAGYVVFGPSAAAARLEGSKAFAKEVMAAAGVPTAAAHVCTTGAQLDAALATLGAPHVVKDDGLAAGKGVVVTDDLDAARAHGLACLAKSGGRVLVEEYLDGPEVSVFCLCDGTTVRALAPAQDFKRAGDGDRGPNTGGMGAYSPLPWAPPDFGSWVAEQIGQPIVAEMAQRGTPFVGTLYVGLAMTARGPRVVEFNVRLGDPDGQVSLARLAVPLGQLLYAAATGRLGAHLPAGAALPETERSVVLVVLAAQGYPATVRSGDPITGIEAAERVPDAWVLHAGTAHAPASGAADTGSTASVGVVSAGGRVLDVVATGADLAAARETAYRALAHLGLAGSHHRTDIAAAAARGLIRIPEGR